MRRLLLSSASLVIAAPVMAQTAGPCATTAAPNYAATGTFGILGGQLYAPDGSPFQARGVNVMWGGNDPSAATLRAQFPGTNMIRLAIYKDGSGNYPSAASLTSYVNDLTSHGIVVELEDHTNSTGENSGGGKGFIYTGSLLTQELNWYSSVASAFKSNPYVWFGTDNEPSQTNPATNQTDPAALSDWQLATYNAIRNAGNSSPIMLEGMGWGQGNQAVLNQGYKASDYAKMYNTMWDVHYYGWWTNGSTNQSTDDAMLSSIVQAAQQIKNADGAMPVIIGEFGNSTDGVSIDSNANQVLKAVTSNTEIAGGLSWAYGSGNPGGADGLVNGAGSLTSQGQAIASWIDESGATGCPAATLSIAQQLALAAQTSGGTTPSTGTSGTGGTTGTVVATVPQSLSLDQVAALAMQTASGTAGGTLTDPTTAAVLAQGAAPVMAVPVLAAASPGGTMPVPAAVSSGTSFTASGSYQTVVPPSGNDTGLVSGTGNSITATGGVQTITVTGAGNTITTGPYNDTITLSSAGNTIDAGGGNDTVILTYGGGATVPVNADPAAIAPLALVGNRFLAPAPGTGTLTIQGTLAGNDQIDLTRALAGTTWDHTPATMWNYVIASASVTGCTISVGGQVVVSIPGGAPNGQLGRYVTAQ